MGPEFSLSLTRSRLWPQSEVDLEYASVRIVDTVSQLADTVDYFYPPAAFVVGQAIICSKPLLITDTFSVQTRLWSYGATARRPWCPPGGTSYVVLKIGLGLHSQTYPHWLVHRGIYASTTPIRRVSFWGEMAPQAYHSWTVWHSSPISPYPCH